MYVFREGRRSVSSAELRRTLLGCLQSLATATNGPTGSSVLMETLLRAGEFECALADCGHPQQHAVAAITDEIASQLLPHKTPDYSRLSASLSSLSLPVWLTISVPEGFAYYALHPQQYADLAEGLPLQGPRVVVVGIRSIGTTLSAVVMAALRNRGLLAERMTVRPEGHPFDRVVRFTAAHVGWVKHNQAADFLVVDEGPGLSGSSFLSTGEALADLGVAHERITFLCAHQPDFGQLCSRSAAARAEKFRWREVPSANHLPHGAEVFIGAGGWRERFIGNNSEWPASWTNMERAKFLSGDGAELYKFEGLGHYGAAVRKRAGLLADAGFSPKLGAQDDTGFVRYRVYRGQKLAANAISETAVEVIARYCALRADAFAVVDTEHCEKNQADLEMMVRTNLTEEFGSDPRQAPASLHLVRPVVADGRMQPWEWIVADGRLVKFDGASHGDDHFFPGPTDIAWDLAGAIVEFSVSGVDQSAIAPALLDRYRRFTGDDAGPRLPGYLLAYSAFRLGYCKMAANAMRGSSEEPRLQQQYLKYRDFVTRLLARREAA